jgi:hypothetical protein
VDVRLPNGFVIKGAPSNITQKEIRRIALKNNLARPEDFAESGIIPGVIGGAKRLISSGQTAIGALTGSAEEAAQAGRERERKISEQYAPAADLGKVGKAYDEQGLWAATKEVASQAPKAVAEMAPFMGATALGAIAGQALIPIPIVGAAIGAALPSLLTRGGTNIEQQAAAQEAKGVKPEDINISRTAAFGTAVPMAALDVAGTAIPVLGRAAVAKILGPAFEKALARGTTAELEKVAAQTLTRRVASGIGENLAVQGVIQPTQVMLGRLQAGQDLLSEEALNEYGHALYAAGLLSPIGAVGGIRERGAARTELGRQNEVLDTARDALFKKVGEDKLADPEAPSKPQSVLAIQKTLGVELSQAKDIREKLIERGDLIRTAGKERGYHLNPELAPKIEELTKPTTAVEEGTAAKAPGEFTESDLLGEIVERPPEVKAKEALDAAIPGGEAPPVVRTKITSPESPVYQNIFTAVQGLHEANIPITFNSLREATKELGVKPIHINPLLNEFTRAGILSKPDENKIRVYNREVVEGGKPYEAPVSEPTRTDAESVRRGVEASVLGREGETGVPERDIAGRVGNVGEPTDVLTPPERRVEPALEIPEGEAVPYSAQPSAPDIFVPSPEQARVSTEAIDTGLVPGRGIERAKKTMGRQEEVAEVLPEEGVSAKRDSVAESLRAGNLGEALYRLRDETSGKSPLSWLADKLLNVVEVKDDRTPLIKAEVERVAREQGINKEKEPEAHANMARQIERAIMSDVDLTKYDFTDYEGRLTEAGKLRKGFKPQVERMVPIKKGRATYNRDTGKLEFIKPAPEPEKPANLYRPYVLETPKTETPFKQAFGGAKVFVEGNADLKGQNKAVIERLKREGKLAEYNPKTNAFYFTEAGLTDRVILHEMVHSATVGVMKKFLSRQVGDLTTAQREGAKEIVRIYNFTKKVLGSKFKNAYENEYEFITHAMTHEGFQRALSNFRARKPSVETKLRSAWDSFTTAVAKMVGLDKFAQQAKPLSTKVRAAGELDNALLRTIDSINDILTVPKAGVEVEPLAARRQPTRRRIPNVRQPPAPRHNGATKNVFKDTGEKSRSLLNFAKRQFNNEGYERLIFNIQDHKRGFLTLEQQLERSGLIQRDGDFNNTHERMTAAPQKQDTISVTRISPLINDLSSAVAGYAKKVGMAASEAMEHLGVLRMAMNEVEKRYQKYIETVDLRDDVTVNLGSKAVTPAEYRSALLTYFAQTKAKMTDAQVLSFKNQLEGLVNRFVKPGAEPIDSPKYQVVGYHPTDLKIWRRAYAREMRTNKAEMDKVFDTVKAINEERIALDREGKYWTNQVDNFRRLYGYEHYVPYKGMDSADLGYELDTNARAGSQYKQLADKSEGRRSGINNPLSQIVQDLYQAGSRAAQEGITQSVVNQIKSGDLAGKLVERVAFEDRYNGRSKEDLTGKNVLFHHVGNGDVEIYSLKDPKLVEGLNGLHNDLSLKAEMLNSVTRFMGRQHTFYNVAFAPVNFVRDVLTNAYNASGRFGITMAPKIIGEVLKTSLTSWAGLKATKISWLYEKGDVAAIRNMKGSFAKDAYEYLIEQGGKSSFQKASDVKTIEQEVVGKGRWYAPKKAVDAKKAVDRVFTAWSDTFEFVSRVATYTAVKRELIAEAKAQGKNINTPVAMNSIKQNAAMFSKNLFNYEKVGKYGRELGALYMFMRPSLTSAVRVADVLQPLWPGENVQKAMSRGPDILKVTDRADPRFAKAEAARKAFTERYEKEKLNAGVLAGVLTAAGMGMYAAALTAADNDEFGRNKVATDDPALWTRALRWNHKFPGEGNDFFQMPWGFGGGAFGAMGAQFAIWGAGNQSTKSLFENMIPIMLDSFMPLPVPRFSPLESPGQFAVSSAFPSALRPFVEFTLNMDGIGRQIYNDRTSKYGNAYSGNEYIPKWARDFTEFMAKNTAGFEEPAILDPRVVSYLASTYFDAISRVASTIYGMVDPDSKEFNLKKDIPVIGGFIGKSTNIDARQFQETSTKVEKMSENIATYSGRPEFDTYLLNHPEEVTIVELHKSRVNGRLKQLQSEEKAINAGVGIYSDITEKTKQQRLKDIGFEKKFIMKDFVESYKILKDQSQ